MDQQPQSDVVAEWPGSSNLEATVTSGVACWVGLWVQVGLVPTVYPWVVILLHCSPRGMELLSECICAGAV